jgi:HK97 family phage portal protein
MLRAIKSAVRRALARVDRKAAPAQNPVARLIQSWQANRPLTPHNDFRALLDEGYRRNVVVYCCISERATTAARQRFKALTPDEKEAPPDHPLLRLLKRPNPEQSRFEFTEGVLTNLYATGNAYIHKARNSYGMPVQLWNVRPDRMRIVPGANGFVDRYEYRVGGEVKPKEIPADEVIHLKFFDPLDDYYGLSPLAVVNRVLQLDDQTLDYLRAFYTNGGAPAGILKLKEPAEPAERQRIKQLWKDEYGTKTGWHELLVLDASADYQAIGSRPDKLAMDAVWGVTETRICAALDVPPAIVQLAIGINPTHSNYKEAVKSFWHETLIPDLERLGDALTLGLAPEFSGELEVAPDLSDVEVLHEGQSETRRDAILGYEAEIITKNEARRLWKRPAVEGGDEFRAAA